jgi:hypothetical protein
MLISKQMVTADGALAPPLNQSVACQLLSADGIGCRPAGIGRQPTFVHIRFVLSERLLCAEERKPTSQHD